MNTLEKLQALCTEPNIQDVSIKVNGTIVSVRMKKLSYFDSQKIASIPFDINSDGDAVFDRTKMPERNSALIVACLVNEDGTPALTKEQANELDSQVGQQLLKAANILNGFIPKPVEEAAKNS